jgi:hypothetical protein
MLGLWQAKTDFDELRDLAETLQQEKDEAVKTYDAEVATIRANF